MKKISSAILLSAFIAFINCKSNVGQTAGEDNKDSESIFYQSLINLGNGFIDVFNAFGGLVADKFFKTDPKKSDVKIYFESITKTLKDTKDNLEKLSSEKEGNDSGTTNSEIDETVKKVNGWLEKMLKAAGDVAKAAAAVGDGKIGESATNGVKADAASVKGIAIGIKGIVDAAAEGGVKLEPAAVAVDDVSNKEAGKMFGAGVGVGANAADVAKAAAAVGVVSGEQILKAIAAAAGDSGKHEGKKGNDAENAIQAAIGGDQQGGEAFNDGKLGKKSDQIAAALVLRGMAKDGKFSVAADAAQKTAKSTVEAAVGKTANALVGIIKVAIENGLKSVGAVVKKAGNGGPTAVGAGKNPGNKVIK